MKVSIQKNKVGYSLKEEGIVSIGKTEVFVRLDGDYLNIDVFNRAEFVNELKIPIEELE